MFTFQINKSYISVQQDELKKYFQERLRQFNEEVLSVHLVMFDDVLHHLLRIDRVIR